MQLDEAIYNRRTIRKFKDKKSRERKDIRNYRCCRRVRDYDLKVNLVNVKLY